MCLSRYLSVSVCCIVFILCLIQVFKLLFLISSILSWLGTSFPICPHRRQQITQHYTVPFSLVISTAISFLNFLCLVANLLSYHCLQSVVCFMPQFPHSCFTILIILLLNLFIWFVFLFINLHSAPFSGTLTNWLIIETKFVDIYSM